MEKRYQVFISSTFEDLRAERQEVSEALLRAECFPVGMELFPAADEETFDFIKTVIDQSDYFIVLSAGRYGSLHPETGLSFTEMEYDYAVAIGKPIIRLLHKDPKGRADEGDQQLIKLLQFQEKLRGGRMVAHWETRKELAYETLHALLELKNTKPAVGWVRADRVASEEAELETYKLREKVEKLTQELDDKAKEPDLTWRLPTTERALFAILGREDYLFLYDFISDLERDIRLGFARTKFDLGMSLSSQDGLDDNDAELILDALLIDKFLTYSTESRLKLTTTGQTILAKARLQALEISKA